MTYNSKPGEHKLTYQEALESDLPGFEHIDKLVPESPEAHGSYVAWFNLLEEKRKKAKNIAEELDLGSKSIPEIYEEIKKVRTNLEKRIDEGASQKAKEIEEVKEAVIKKKAQEKAEEYLEEWIEEESNRLEAENDLAKLANFGKVREEAQEEVKEEREKFRKLAQIVMDDEELLELFWSGPITEERFKVLFRATEDPELRQELESVQEVNGNIELWIERKAEELEEEVTGEPQEEVTPKPREPEPKEERIFGEEEPSAPEEAETEKPESELSEEELIARLKEEFSTTKKDIIRCLEKGISSSSKIAEKLGVTPQTVRNHYGGLKEHGLITTGATGAGLTEDGLRFAEALK